MFRLHGLSVTGLGLMSLTRAKICHVQVQRFNPSPLNYAHIYQGDPTIFI
ncbi:hypothetical protein Hanom_Chr16g01496151 [Helianthus anomalus]